MENFGENLKNFVERKNFGEYRNETLFVSYFYFQRKNIWNEITKIEYFVVSKNFINSYLAEVFLFHFLETMEKNQLGASTVSKFFRSPIERRGLEILIDF